MQDLASECEHPGTAMRKNVDHLHTAPLAQGLRYLAYPVARGVKNEGFN